MIVIVVNERNSRTESISSGHVHRPEAAGPANLELSLLFSHWHGFRFDRCHAHKSARTFLIRRSPCYSVFLVIALDCRVLPLHEVRVPLCLGVSKYVLDSRDGHLLFLGHSVGGTGHQLLLLILITYIVIVFYDESGLLLFFWLNYVLAA